MSRSVTAELVMEEGGFDRDLPFLEKRPPRIAIADRSGKLIERSGTLEKVRTTYWGQGGRKGGGMERKEGRRMVVRDRRCVEREPVDPPLDAVRDRRGSELLRNRLDQN